MDESLQANAQVFIDIDKEINKFYDLLKDKKIEPSGSIEEVGRIEPFFNKTLKIILDLVKKSSLDDTSKEISKYNLTIDFHTRTAEKYKYNNLTFIGALSKKNMEIYTDAATKIQQYM